MADLPSGFWAGWVLVLTVVSFAVLAWLVYAVYFREGPPQEDHVWDGDLREGDAPAPMWWFWLTLSLMVFSVIYLLLYPGLGSFKGALGWSQSHHLEHGLAAHAAEFGPAAESMLEIPLTDLAKDPHAMNTAASLFAVRCASCHGADGAGQANRFPNLRDEAWQWGGDPAAIEHSIALGRNALMPPWGEVLGEDGVEAVVDFVMVLGTEAADAERYGAGKAAYTQICASCHQQDGSGNTALGAPSLVDDAWLYGSGRAAVKYAVVQGRNGIMPAQRERLTAVQIRLLTAWLVAGMPDALNPGTQY